MADRLGFVRQAIEWSISMGRELRREDCLMSGIATPDLADKESAAAIDVLLADLQQPTTGTNLSPSKRRRLRDLLAPKANGDQDTW
jgi:hypothetical protein